MGPHFAVGDTCYSFEEESKTYNPDGKEIVAKDNECSLLRDTDMEKAYFGCHTDITIPYDELGSIIAYDEQGNTVGCAINVAPVGFGGPIVIKVGFKVDSKTGQNLVWNTKVLSHAETPGLGAKCSEPAFADQFKGLDPAQKKLSVTKDGGDIDAITASTITSRAFVNGVATAVNVLSAIAGTPVLIDTATGASSTEWTAPTDSTNLAPKRCRVFFFRYYHFPCSR